MGGDMIETIIRQLRPTVPYRGVVARRGKVLRAEPVSALYEQGRVSHHGIFPELENQMTTWVAGEADFSPDRLDALVHGITSLNIGAEGGADRYFASIAPRCPSCDYPNAANATQCLSCARSLQ
jgi:phage terminase large subunit-like protein